MTGLSGYRFIVVHLHVQVVEDYPDQQPEVIARALLNHGAKLTSPKV